MAPTVALRSVARSTLKSAVVAAGPIIARRSAEHLVRRDLTVTDTQKVTLGIIGAYVVVIALLWNIPYVRNVLWPFKVCARHPSLHPPATSRLAWPSAVRRDQMG